MSDRAPPLSEQMFDLLAQMRTQALADDGVPSDAALLGAEMGRAVAAHWEAVADTAIRHSHHVLSVHLRRGAEEMRRRCELLDAVAPLIASRPLRLRQVAS